MQEKNNNKKAKEEILENKKESFLNMALELLSDLPPRAQEIVQKRNGFFSGKEETLEKIGKDYGITRERVRQIIADTDRKILKKKNNLNFKKSESQIIFTIDEKFGIIEKSELVKKMAGDDKREANALVFLFMYSDKIFKADSEKVKESLYTREESLERATVVGDAAREILTKEKRLLSSNEIAEKIGEKVKQKISKEEILSFLDVLRGIKKNNFGKWGISSWVEINPKGTREKIYTILKEKNKPLHFMEIAKIMDEVGLGKKKAHPQTIHNELIKNEQFILIGRGIYALREWGYTDGTVKDVLEEIFKKSEKPLSKEEILKKVMKIRNVKKATVMINLGNSRYFSKEKGLYFLKKSKTSAK